MRSHLLLCALWLTAPLAAHANPPVASYIFPAGGQRGTTVDIRVGGLFLQQGCGFEMLGPGVKASPRLQRIPTRWFEGPILPLPDSQRQEDYPKDMKGSVQVERNAQLGWRTARLWTSEGAASGLRFVVGDLPEIVEEEVDGDPVPVAAQLPVTINGRIFPRSDVDVWTVTLKQGEQLACEVMAARLASPLDSRLEILDPSGRRIAENDDHLGADSYLRFTAPVAGVYQVRIHDTGFLGSQSHVYRLTLTNGPHVERFYPLGGRRGSKIRLELAGQKVPAAPLEVTIPDQAEREYQHLLTLNGHTQSLWLDVDELPEFQTSGGTKPITIPAVCNGRIAQPGAVESWSFPAKKGEILEIELRAARLGSRLDGVLSVVDATGKQLARAEASGNQPDPVLRFTVPVEGSYRVQVQDRFRSRGGPDFPYRLRLAPPPTPDFRLSVPTDALTLLRKDKGKLKINAERFGGFKEPITLEVQGLPAGVTVNPTTLAPNQAALDLQFQADTSVAIRPAHLKIVGKAKVGGEAVLRTAQLNLPRGAVPVKNILLGVGLPAPFKLVGQYDMGFAPRGGVHSRKYRIERKDFDGPIEVSLTDRQARHLQGVTGPTITIPAGVNEFTYSALLPPWMETGRTCRVCVMGVGVVKEPDGSQHHVSFSSVNQNEQLVAVVGPGRLALELDRTSVLATPGGKVAVQAQIKRDRGLSGVVKLELLAPAHFRGITAEPCTIAADEQQGSITLRFGADLSTAFNMPVVIRATLLQEGRPVIAERKVEVQR